MTEADIWMFPLGSIRCWERLMLRTYGLKLKPELRGELRGELTLKKTDVLGCQ